MSDIYGNTSQGNPYRSAGSNPYATKPANTGLTTAQAQLRPYIKDEKEKKKVELSMVGLLPIVFDILQTANYASAGAVDAIWKSVKNGEPFPDHVKNAIKGAWNGLTWKDKKTYSEVLRGNMSDEDLAKYDQKLKVAGYETGISPVSVAGFVGDILLDPLTYMSFGATSAAKATAREAAEDAVKIATKTFVRDNLDTLGQQGIKTFNRILDKKGDDAAREFLRRSAPSYEQYISNVSNKAYREALVAPGEKIRNKYLGQIDEYKKGAGMAETGAPKLSSPYSAGKELLAGVPQETGEKMFRQPFAKGDKLAALTEKLQRDTTYALGGERSFRFIGKTIPGTKSVREPWAVQRTWNALRNHYESTEVGRKFGDAWWSMMNTGPMKSIREAFNVRSPYQRILRNKELESLSEVQAIFADKAKEVKVALEGLSDLDMKTMRTVVDAAELASKKYGFKQPLSQFGTDLIQRMEQETGEKLTSGGYQKIGKAFKAIERIDKKNLRSLYQLEAEGLITSAPDELAYYLRSYYRNPPKAGGVGIGGSNPNIVNRREFAHAEVMQQDIGWLKAIFGFDDATAQKLVNEGGGYNFSSNLEEMMMSRAVIQSKIEAKANLWREVKEFGVDTKSLGLGTAEANDILKKATEMGLEPIASSVPAFEGLLFDPAARKAVERTVNATQTESLDAMRNIVSNFNSWWKGTALLGPHTKIRNFVDNNWTGFMKHGLDWFNIKEYDVPAVIATMYASKASNPKQMLSKFGLDEGMAKRLLNKVWYSDGKKAFTLKDLSNIARQKGVFTERTMGYDTASTITNILGKERKSLAHKVMFVGHETSHKIDEIVENSARIKSFLMDFKNVTKDLPKGSDAQFAVDWSAREAKKWFIDYSDLSEMERKVFKQIIPFYSFMRHNVANKLQSIVMYPETFSIFPKFQEMAKIDDPGYDPDLIPSYMKNINMFPAIKTGEGTYGMLNTGLSVVDFNRIPLMWEEGSMTPKFSMEEFKDDIVSSAHPVLKTIVEMIPEKGYDTFRKRDLSDTAKAPYILRYLSNSPTSLTFLDGLMRVIGFEDGLKATVDNNGKLNIDAKIARVMESNMPLIRHLDMLLLTGGAALEQLIPGVEKMIEEGIGAKSDYEGLEKSFQIMAYWTGVKFKENDVEDMKKQLGRDIYYSAQKRRIDDMRQTEKGQLRSLAYRRNMDRRIRRLGL